ncbi:MAG TPA: universal stress protein [Terriglobales bacterium]|jgi:two-component system sensor histidine kinase KdpD|nr:universal stress protein [Terriglobales bacterium]
MVKKPEEWLAEVMPPEKARGIFKLFLGYAPGVGKTYAMLSEGIRRHARGEDVVIGIVETHGRKTIAELAQKLEAVPRRKLEYKGTVFEEMDVDAVVARHPQVVLLDELAHTNVPGSKHRKRYEDVQEILAAKIDVIATLNIQHVESIAPIVRSITGVTVRETVPDWVPLMANETVMVDLTPEALQNRLRRGDVYSPDKIEQALQNFFRSGNLNALRELALRQVAEHVDRSLESYMEAKDIEENWAVRERLAVCISSNPAAQYLIARGARMARRLDAQFYVIHVDTGNDSGAERQKTLQANIQFARDLNAEVIRVPGRNIAETVAKAVKDKHITQVIFGRSAVKGLHRLFYLSAVHRFLREAPSVDVHIVTHGDPVPN